MPKGLQGFQKGHKQFSSKGCFIKGHSTWNKGKKGLQKHSDESRKKMSLSKQGKCFRENNGYWKGGKTKNEDGYVLIKKSNHPHATKNGYILEHRLIMEKIIGRYIRPKEVVHHINGDILDNRKENLMLFANASKHTEFHNNKRKGML